MAKAVMPQSAGNEPSGPASVGAEIAETHSAWVVMLGDHAYKIKKPVHLDFLDFSTREARERAVHREVELNRRLAPDVYLGVADVTGPDGEVCEHVIVMRRMPAERRLATLVRDHVPLDDELRAIARAVAVFHAGALQSSAISAAGRPDVVRARVERDLDELGAFVGTILEASLLEEAGALARRYLQGRTPLLEGRVARGLVVDGHGDLLADDIFCLDDGPRILDCIDFDDGLRHGDVLADVAFLAMDLERLGAPESAACFLDAYQEFSAEQHPATLANYYVATRALVRSKVACLRAGQDGGASVPKARRLLELAVDHLHRAQVRLVLVGGSPGTGKSTLASALAGRMGYAVLRSDEVRKEMIGLAHGEHADAPFGAGAYDEATTDATYTELLVRARQAMDLGVSVILDASWSGADQRGKAAQVADASSADLVELRCDAPAEVTATRIVDRRGRGADASDATPAIAAAMRAAFDPWPTAGVVSTVGSEQESTDAAVLAVRSAGRTPP